jgi:hypothetical protein
VQAQYPDPPRAVGPSGVTAARRRRRRAGWTREAVSVRVYVVLCAVGALNTALTGKSRRVDGGGRLRGRVAGGSGGGRKGGGGREAVENFQAKVLTHHRPAAARPQVQIQRRWTAGLGPEHTPCPAAHPLPKAHGQPATAAAGGGGGVGFVGVGEIDGERGANVTGDDAESGDETMAAAAGGGDGSSWYRDKGDGGDADGAAGDGPEEGVCEVVEVAGGRLVRQSSSDKLRQRIVFDAGPIYWQPC